MKNTPRYFVNKLLLEEFSNKTKVLDDLVLIGKGLSYQLKVLTAVPMFKQVVEKYIYLSSYLLSPGVSERVRSIDLEGYYLLRATRVYYFGQKDESLEGEIENALEKNPNSLVFNDLKMKLRSKFGKK